MSRRPIRRRGPITSADYRVEDTGHVSPCWIWTHIIGRYGYGRIWTGQVREAHRVMYEQEIGPIPKKRLLHHLCHQRACIRPDHLEAMTAWRHGKLHHPRTQVRYTPNRHKPKPPSPELLEENERALERMRTLRERLENLDLS